MTQSDASLKRQIELQFEFYFFKGYLKKSINKNGEVIISRGPYFSEMTKKQTNDDEFVKYLEKNKKLKVHFED